MIKSFMLDALRFLESRFSKQSFQPVFKDLPSASKGFIACVDGGSCVIADGGCWILSKLRVGFTQYSGVERVSEGVSDEYYTIVRDDGFSHSMSKLEPEFGNIRELGEAVPVTMRTLEFKQALDLVSDLPENSVLVIDGLLDGDTRAQQRLITNLEVKAKKRGVNVVGLAKTFRQGVSGRSIIGSLLAERPGSKWLHELRPDLFIVKLHSRASHAYALNFFESSDLERVLEVLSFYSRDPAIIGYPYPLLRVDRVARFNGHEKRLELNKLRLVCQEHEFKFIEFDEQATNMHSVMDSQKYR